MHGTNFYVIWQSWKFQILTNFKKFHSRCYDQFSWQQVEKRPFCSVLYQEGIVGLNSNQVKFIKCKNILCKMDNVPV